MLVGSGNQAVPALLAFTVLFSFHTFYKHFTLCYKQNYPALKNKINRENQKNAQQWDPFISFSIKQHLKMTNYVNTIWISLLLKYWMDAGAEFPNIKELKFILLCWFHFTTYCNTSNSITFNTWNKDVHCDQVSSATLTEFHLNAEINKSTKWKIFSKKKRVKPHVYLKLGKQKTETEETTHLPYEGQTVKY